MIDRFLYWGNHVEAKSGKIKGSCQPPLDFSLFNKREGGGSFLNFELEAYVPDRFTSQTGLPSNFFFFFLRCRRFVVRCVVHLFNSRLQLAIQFSTLPVLLGL